jgi:hypothetical protein
MKKLIFIFIFAVLISPIFAQQQQQTPEERRQAEEASLHDHRNIYYISTPVEKVYFAGTGYLIHYRKANGTGYVGIPYDWFTWPASQAELILLPKGTNWPYMSVFYKDGEFSHVRLYVHRQRSHITWGVTPFGADVSKWFSTDGTFNFQY